jgi:hypothetical protein
MLYLLTNTKLYIRLLKHLKLLQLVYLQNDKNKYWTLFCK